MTRSLGRYTVLSFALLGLFVGTAVAGHRGPAPETAFQMRLGGFFPDADSDFWKDNQDVFTLDESDFDDIVFGMSLIYAVNNNVEVGLNIDFYDEDVRSQYRDPIPGFPDIIPEDVNGFPIVHDTELELVPVTFDVRFIPGGRYRIRGPQGRQVLKPVFYLGAGAGVTLWDYEEVGDFIDFSTDPEEIFFDRFKDDGAAFETHVLAGVELPLSRSTNLLIEARHSWAEDDLDDDFAGLGDLDLGGTSAYAGLSWRF